MGFRDDSHGHGNLNEALKRNPRQGADRLFHSLAPRMKLERMYVTPARLTHSLSSLH